MSSEEDGRSASPGDFELTDPKAMRALAHPVRMALLELLGAHQTLTATQAAELLGETPANCAFHLRTLAKYGFVEEAGGGRGRERPWRSATRGIRIRSRQDNPQAAIAAQALGDMWRERWFERARRSLAAPLSEPWQQARTFTVGQCYLTAEELKQIGDDVAGLIAKFADRDDSAQRPEDAMSVELAYFGYPIADPIQDIS
jgi:predicted transcriptional regulator